MVEKKRVSSPEGNECRKIPLGVVSQLRRKKIKNIRRKRSEIGQRRFNGEAKTNTDVAGDVRDSYDKKNDDDSSTEISVSVSSFSDQLSENDVDLAGNGDRSRSKIDTCESYGVVSMIGRRREMEDAISVKLGFLNRTDYDYDFFGVYDGHGGSRVAEACEKRLHCVVAEEIANNTTAASEGGKTVDWEKVMVVSFEKMDEEVNCNGGGGDGEAEVSASMGRTTGSTAVVVVVGKEEMVVANCGDSRAIISRCGVAVALSIDHKPDRPDELERVEAAGGRVINWNGYRILGVLATSRSIGDQYLKPYVTSKPEVTVITRTDTDEFLILASDGLWDVISNEIACQVVRRCLDGRLKRRSRTYASGRRAPEAAAVLAELAIARGSKDNISVIVVELRKGSHYLC